MSLVAAHRIYTGRVLNLDLDQVRFPDGSAGEMEMVRHPGASAILPFLDDPRSTDPRVVLIRQYRHAADGYVWEVPAGRRDPGETPEACAIRELREETGFQARRILLLTSILPTPGFTDERIHLFLATGLSLGRPAREADEFMEIHELRWSVVGRMIRRGEIQDGKTLCTLMFVQNFGRGETP